MKGDFSTVREDGVKITVLVYRKPKKYTKTWATATGHNFNYAGIGGRGLRKGNSTKSNSF